MKLEIQMRVRPKGSLYAYHIVKIDELEQMVTVKGPGRFKKRQNVSMDTMKEHWEPCPHARAK